MMRGITPGLGAWRIPRVLEAVEDEQGERHEGPTRMLGAMREHVVGKI